MTDDDRATIVVGQPLQFSIYGADNALILPQGQFVSNEFVRQGLLKSGRYCKGQGWTKGAGTSATASYPRLSVPLYALQQEYSQLARRDRGGFRMTGADEKTTGVSYALGVLDGALIMSNALDAQGNALDLRAGQVWTFRGMYGQAALRFKTTISAVATEPFRHFYLTKPADVELHNVRKWPRAPVCLNASRFGDEQRIVVDIGVGGARVAVDEDGKLSQGQLVLLHLVFPLLEQESGGSFEGEVINLYSKADANHPHIEFYGVRFVNLSTLHRLQLHAYVQEQLNFEMDRVGQTLGRVM